MLTTLTTVALLAGGGMPASRQPTPAASSTPITTASNGIISVPLQVGQNCPKDDVVCASGEPALSLTQIRSLAKVFGVNVRLTKASTTSLVTLNLEFPNVHVRIYGIGLPTSFTLKGESYYSAGSILSFLAQSSPNAFYTASPRPQLHTDRVTVDMGALPTNKVKFLFSGLASPIVEALLPDTLRPTAPCEKCDIPGVAYSTWSDLPPQRLQTNLAPGEVALLLTYNPKNFRGLNLNTPYVAAVGIVEAGGWVNFPVEKRPTRLVTDPAQLRPDPLNAGNGLLLRMTNTPLGHPTEGIISIK